MIDTIKEVLTFVAVLLAVISPMIGAGYWIIKAAIKRGSFMEMIKTLVEKVESIEGILQRLDDKYEESRERHRAAERLISEHGERIGKLEVLVYTNQNSKARS